MSAALLGALFLNFAGAASAIIWKTGRENVSRITFELFGIVTNLGVIAIFLSIFLFIKDQGISYGLLYFVISAVVFIPINSRLMDGFRSLLSLGAIIIGSYFAFRALV
jgi:hypothetical protein